MVYAHRIQFFLKNNVNNIMIIVVTLACISFFIYLKLYFAGALSSAFRQVSLQVKEKIDYAMKKNIGKNSFSYNHQRAKFDSLGVTYYSNGRVTPVTYIVYKMLVVVIVVVTGVTFNFFAGVAFGVCAYLIPDIYITKRNNRDNYKMLKDISILYDCILLQSKSEYITQILVDCYRLVKHKRLKTALLELSGDITKSGDFDVSVTTFANKFANENIFNLVILVKQLYESATTQEMLLDIKKRLNIIQKSYNKYEQERIKRQGFMCTMAIFASSMMIVIYACVVFILDSMKLFS